MLFYKRERWLLKDPWLPVPQQLERKDLGKERLLAHHSGKWFTAIKGSTLCTLSIQESHPNYQDSCFLQDYSCATAIASGLPHPSVQNLMWSFLEAGQLAISSTSLRLEQKGLRSRNWAQIADGAAGRRGHAPPHIWRSITQWPQQAYFYEKCY